jgi:hypothetical protein
MLCSFWGTLYMGQNPLTLHPVSKTITRLQFSTCNWPITVFPRPYKMTGLCTYFAVWQPVSALWTVCLHKSQFHSSVFISSSSVQRLAICRIWEILNGNKGSLRGQVSMYFNTQVTWQLALTVLCTLWTNPEPQKEVWRVANVALCSSATVLQLREYEANDATVCTRYQHSTVTCHRGRKTQPTIL